MSRHLIQIHPIGGGAKIRSETLLSRTQGSHSQTDDAAREPVDIRTGAGKWDLGTDTLYLATKFEIAGSASARKWEECRGMVLEGQVWRGAGNGAPERSGTGLLAPT